ncbi:MAG: hypothetical protein JRF25_11490, partial [Deltaproteobacteria bacterium]|nr:hypothetical protein [Deltaproteobacteria bacterium]
IVKEGGDWLKRFLDRDETSPHSPIFDEKTELLQILKSYYLFGKDSKEADLGKAIIKRAGIDDPEVIFKILLKTGVFEENENIDLYRYDIRVLFPDKFVYGIRFRGFDVDFRYWAHGSDRSFYDDHRRGCNP